MMDEDVKRIIFADCGFAVCFASFLFGAGMPPLHTACMAFGASGMALFGYCIYHFMEDDCASDNT